MGFADDGEIQIREAGEGDAEQVADLWTEAYVTLGVGGRTEPYAGTDFFDSAGRGTVLIADGPDGIDGVVVLYPPTGSDGPAAAAGEAELARLAVAAGVRRRGVGRALAERCGQRARAAGWPAIALWSRPAQTVAHRLYESLGYVRAPERDSVDANGQGRVVFRLALDPPHLQPAGR